MIDSVETRNWCALAIAIFRDDITTAGMAFSAFDTGVPVRRGLSGNAGYLKKKKAKIKKVAVLLAKGLCYREIAKVMGMSVAAVTNFVYKNHDEVYKCADEVKSHYFKAHA